MQNIFQDIKDRVDLKDLVHYYGLDVNTEIISTLFRANLLECVVGIGRSISLRLPFLIISKRQIFDLCMTRKRTAYYV